MASAATATRRRVARSGVGAARLIGRSLARTTMYTIHRQVRRTQLYLDEDMARLLAAESRRRGTTVSWLVRDAVATQYGRQPGGDRSAIIGRLAGVWAGRDDIGRTEEIVRRERRSRRSQRWVGRRGGEVPPRQRRHH
jgi:hypothetical protein